MTSNVNDQVRELLDKYKSGAITYNILTQKFGSIFEKHGKEAINEEYFLEFSLAAFDNVNKTVTSKPMPFNLETFGKTDIRSLLNYISKGTGYFGTPTGDNADIGTHIEIQEQYNETYGGTVNINWLFFVLCIYEYSKYILDNYEYPYKKHGEELRELLTEEDAKVRVDICRAISMIGTRTLFNNRAYKGEYNSEDETLFKNPKKGELYMYRLLTSLTEVEIEDEPEINPDKIKAQVNTACDVTNTVFDVPNAISNDDSSAEDYNDEF